MGYTPNLKDDIVSDSLLLDGESVMIIAVLEFPPMASDNSFVKGEDR